MEAISIKEYSKIKHEIFTTIKIEFQGKKFEVYKNLKTEFSGLKSKYIGSYFKINNTISRSNKKNVINYILKN
jgi:hypothetical protein